MADTAVLEQQLADKDREIATLRGRLEDEVGTFKRLVDIATRLTATLNLSELLSLIMNNATELLGAETSSLLLLDEETGELTFEVATGAVGQAAARHRVPKGQGIAGWVLENRQPVVIVDVPSDPRFYRGIDEAIDFETRNMVAVPMAVRDQIIGVVEVINKQHGDFVQADVELAGALASQAAIAIDNARLYARLADAVVTARMSYRL